MPGMKFRVIEQKWLAECKFSRNEGWHWKNSVPGLAVALGIYQGLVAPRSSATVFCIELETNLDWEPAIRYLKGKLTGQSCLEELEDRDLLHESENKICFPT